MRQVTLAVAAAVFFTAAAFGQSAVKISDPVKRAELNLVNAIKDGNRGLQHSAIAVLLNMRLHFPEAELNDAYRTLQEVAFYGKDEDLKLKARFVAMFIKDPETPVVVGTSRGFMAVANVNPFLYHLISLDLVLDLET